MCLGGEQVGACREVGHIDVARQGALGQPDLADVCQVAINTQNLPARAAGHKRKCIRAYVATVMQRILLLVGVAVGAAY